MNKTSSHPFAKVKRAVARLAYAGHSLFYIKNDMFELKKTAADILTALNYANYKDHYKDIADLFVIKAAENVELQRYGEDNDGGYILANCFSEKSIAYSFGISDDVSWDAAMAKKGFDVYMYDHTIDALPYENERFHFSRMGVGGKNTENILTLAEIIRRNGHENCRDLILKMDIEGAEYDVINSTEPEILQQFSTIVVEWHHLLDPADNRIIPAIKKLNDLFQCVHLHGQDVQRVRIDDRILPDFMEATYLRRADHVFIDAQHSLPLPIDMPTYSGRPEIYLGNYMMQR